jgi:hypothetical protein
MPASAQESQSSEDIEAIKITGKTNDAVESQIVTQKKWPWLSSSDKKSSQKWQGWSPLSCLPAMGDLVRLSAKNKARRQEAQAITCGEEAKKEAEPITLDLCQTEKEGEVKAEKEEVQILQTSISMPPGAGEAEEAKSTALLVAEDASSSVHMPSSEAAKAVAEGGEQSADISEEALDPVVLDIGFAKVELKKLQTWPKFEFYITAKDGFLTREGAVALLEFLDFVLHLPDVITSGFVLTYDLRECTCPQLDLVSWIMHYVSDPQREEVWHERCVCWKVVVSAGVYFTMAQSVLSFLFTVSPPKCRVFLLTDLDMSDSDSWICYKPEDAEDADNSGMFSTIRSNLLDTFFPAYPHELPKWGHSTPATDSADSAKASTEDLKVVSQTSRTTCRESLSLSFATISQGFDESKGEGYLRVEGHDSPMTDEGLQQIMDFMDEFIDSHNAQNGYGITYDLRHINVPSMSMIMRVADWGKQADRQGKWTKLNTSCKIVVSPGLKFSICKGLLKSFFFICPPVTQTYLLTHPDEPEDTATIFSPAGASDPEESAAVSDLDEDGSSCGNSADASESTVDDKPEKDEPMCESGKADQEEVAEIDEPLWQRTSVFGF